jgi:hypothetical protein
MDEELVVTLARIDKMLNDAKPAMEKIMRDEKNKEIKIINHIKTSVGLQTEYPKAHGIIVKLLEADIQKIKDEIK